MLINRIKEKLKNFGLQNCRLKCNIATFSVPYIKIGYSFQGPESWVSVHNLQSQGGGILDPDDRLNDVVDDREQILASFDDGDGAHHHAGGDGASGSSVGTGSPDIFHVSRY